MTMWLNTEIQYMLWSNTPNAITTHTPQAAHCPVSTSQWFVTSFSVFVHGKVSFLFGSGWLLAQHRTMTLCVCVCLCDGLRSIEMTLGNQKSRIGYLHLHADKVNELFVVHKCTLYSTSFVPLSLATIHFPCRCCGMFGDWCVACVAQMRVNGENSVLQNDHFWMWIPSNSLNGIDTRYKLIW